MRLFGLVGYPVSHSFSPGYFAEKWEREGISDCTYRLFPMPSLSGLQALLANHPELCGFNVTLPYKREIIAHLHQLDDTARHIGAVNTVVRHTSGQLTGYNTDAWGFEHSLRNWLHQLGVWPVQTLVLGTGGAAQAVTRVLQQLHLEFTMVSRHHGNGLSYSSLPSAVDWKRGPRLWINTTPLGMSPEVKTCPALPFDHFSTQDLVYDLVYNPPDTLLLQRARIQGASVKNGLEMLHLQADRAWMLWSEI